MGPPVFLVAGGVVIVVGSAVALYQVGISLPEGTLSASRTGTPQCGVPIADGRLFGSLSMNPISHPGWKGLSKTGSKAVD